MIREQWAWVPGAMFAPAWVDWRVGGGYELHTLQIFTVTAEGISRNSVFQDSEVFASFGLAAGLDVQGRVCPVNGAV